MKIAQIKKFEITDEGTLEIELNRGQEGDVCPAEAYISIEKGEDVDDFEVTISCSTDEDLTEVHPKVFDVVNLQKVDNISDSGDYCLMISSYEKMTLDITGACAGVVKVLY